MKERTNKRMIRRLSRSSGASHTGFFAMISVNYGRDLRSPRDNISAVSALSQSIPPIAYG